MAEIDRQYTTSFLSVAVSLHVALPRTIFELFDVEKYRDLEASLDIIPLDRSHTSSYSSSIVTVAISCVVSEIKRDIGRNPRFFHTPFYPT